MNFWTIGGANGAMVVQLELVASGFETVDWRRPPVADEGLRNPAGSVTTEMGEVKRLEVWSWWFEDDTPGHVCSHGPGEGCTREHERIIPLYRLV